jgi:hypothetical protein
MKNDIHVIAKILMVLFCVLIIGGCAASFRGGQLEKIENLNIETSQVGKPSVYFEISWLTGLSPQPKENVYYMPSFVKMVEEIAKESGFFKNIVTVRPATSTDYTIRMSMLNYGNALLASCLGSISGATLTIIPAYARDNYRLSAIIYDSAGNKLKEYQNEDHVNSWIWLPLLPVAPFTKDVGDKVRENMLRHCFQDLAKENILQPLK